MKIAIVSPGSVPFTIGGAEKLAWGLQSHINQQTPHRAELIKLPSPERNFREVVRSYQQFTELDLCHFDLVISTKYPSWMTPHPNHVCYMLHRLRGLYDTYASSGLSQHLGVRDRRVDAVLALMTRHSGQRQALPELFDRLHEIEEAEDLPVEATAFPGPLIRAVVHFLDGVALSTDAIQRHAAISHNVARREGYFPADARVEVVHPPSDLGGLRRGPAEHLFTVCRLDHPKRISLIIEAMRHVSADIPLKIAGTGPEADNLKAMAAGDPRIELLGFVDDREVERLYSRAVAVLYAPCDEDYGLVSAEAMACAKPVITTTDSGGPLELVEHAVTGLVADPNPAALARAIEALIDAPDEAIAMGLRGRERVRDIHWENVCQVLLGREADRPPGPRRVGSARRKITLASTYPVYPPEGGGQVRIFQLYRHLAAYCDVELVTFAGHDAPGAVIDIAAGLREIRVPRSPEHWRLEAALSKKLGGLPVTDIAMPRLHHHSPDYTAALRCSAECADFVVASHPYLLPALEAVTDKPLWYEAHNVEVALKQGILPDSEAGREMLEATRDVERACCERAQLIMACSQEEAAELTALYGDSRGVAGGDVAARTLIVPNGVDVAGVRYVGQGERASRRQQLGLGDSYTALFMGSWHGPNIEAVRSLIRIAEQVPEVNFIVVGSVGAALPGAASAPNVAFMGVLDDQTKEIVLAVADLALNPMMSGAGTNLKMLEYCAAGLPVLTTPHGVRGLELAAGIHVEVAELEGFAARIREAAVAGRSPEREARAERARVQVESRYDWELIAGELLAAIEEL